MQQKTSQKMLNISALLSSCHPVSGKLPPPHHHASHQHRTRLESPFGSGLHSSLLNNGRRRMCLEQNLSVASSPHLLLISKGFFSISAAFEVFVALFFPTWSCSDVDSWDHIIQIRLAGCHRGPIPFGCGHPAHSVPPCVQAPKFKVSQQCFAPRSALTLHCSSGERELLSRCPLSQLPTWKTPNYCSPNRYYRSQDNSS